MDVLALVFPIAMIRSGHADHTPGYILPVILTAAGIRLIMKIRKAKGEVPVLLKISRTGIRDCSPFDPKGFIARDAVRDIRLWESTGSVTALGLVMKEKNVLNKNKTICVNLTYANERKDDILQKAKQYLGASQ